jgi:hypothetical protein
MMNRFYHDFNPDAEKLVQSAGVTYLGKIEPDSSMEEHNLQGKSLLEVPVDSPASLSIKNILMRAGYETL